MLLKCTVAPRISSITRLGTPQTSSRARVCIAAAQKKSVREILLGSKDELDHVDHKQQIDIERLFSYIQELQDKVETMNAAMVQAEQRDRHRMVAVRTMIQESAAKSAKSQQQQEQQHSEDTPHSNHHGVMGGSVFGLREEEEEPEPWAEYRNSFTTLMSEGYMQAVNQLRDSLMATEWELNMRPMALITGVSRFEAFCAQNKINIDYDIITALYDDPLNLSIIEDAQLRMQARSILMQADNEQRLVCYQWCTSEAQKMAQQFSEAEFISKLLPDPLEHGVIDSLKKIAIPMSKMMGI